MITIDASGEWVALGMMVLGSAMLGAIVGAWIVIHFREAVFRLEMRRAREDADRARWARMMGVDEVGAAHGSN